MILYIISKKSHLYFDIYSVLLVALLCQSSLCRHLCQQVNHENPNIIHVETEKIVHSKLHVIKRALNNCTSTTERRFIEIENPVHGYKWSNRTSSNSLIKPTIHQDPQIWTVCSRDRISMFGLSSSGSADNLYYFAIKSGSQIRLDSTPRQCCIDTSDEENDWHFILKYIPSNGRNVIQHCQTKEYVKLDLGENYHAYLHPNLIFTRTLVEASDWSIE